MDGGRTLRPAILGRGKLGEVNLSSRWPINYW